MGRDELYDKVARAQRLLREFKGRLDAGWADEPYLLGDEAHAGRLAMALWELEDLHRELIKGYTLEEKAKMRARQLAR